MSAHIGGDVEPSSVPKRHQVLVTAKHGIGLPLPIAKAAVLQGPDASEVTGFVDKLRNVELAVASAWLGKQTEKKVLTAVHPWPTTHLQICGTFRVWGK